MAEADLEARRETVTGRLRIGAFASAVRGLGAQALAVLAAGHPDLDVELHEVEPDDAIPMTLRGDLELAVVQDWMNAPLTLPEQLERCPLLDDVADVALPAGHPLAERAGLRLSDVDGEAWIGFTQGQICHDWLLHTMRSRGHEPRIAHAASEYASHLELVAAGLGLSVIPRLGRTAVPPEFRVVPVEPALRRHVYGVWRGDAARRPSIQATLVALRTAADVVAPGDRAAGPV